MSRVRIERNVPSPYESIRYAEVQSLRGEYMRIFAKAPTGPQRNSAEWLRQQIGDSEAIKRVFNLRIEYARAHALFS